jgi:hypothetical protein
LVARFPACSDFTRNPWGGEGPQLLFWAAVPVLPEMTALFVLRDCDRLLSVDAMRSK